MSIGTITQAELRSTVPVALRAFAQFGAPSGQVTIVFAAIAMSPRSTEP
jgi:hypothetical protein